MWGSKKKSGSAKIDTLVGRQTVITGDVNFRGGLHIEGTIRGNVTADSDDRSVLVLSEHGIIEGDVYVPNLILNGTVHGDVHAIERVELVAQAKVKGNVYYNLLEMAIGAKVNGNLVHSKDEDLQVEYKDASHDEFPAALLGEISQPGNNS
jgi:cytoskeletal protein CcmA (bactofilin family)